MGTPYCINGHGAIKASSVEQIVDKVLELPERQHLQILAPVIRKKKGQHKSVIEKVQKDGYVRVRVDGEVYDVTEVPELSKSKQHNIDVVVDRIVIKEGIRSRLFDSIEAALRIAEGYGIIDTMDDSELMPFWNVGLSSPPNISTATAYSLSFGGRFLTIYLRTIS